MAAPVWQSKGTDYNPGGTGTSAVVPLPASLAANDIVIIELYKENTAAVTPPSVDWNEITGGGSPPQTNAIQEVRSYWYRAVGGESGTVTFSWTGATFRLASAHRITGCATSGAPIGEVVAAFNNTASTTTPSVETVGSGVDELLFWCASNFNGGATFGGASPSFTERADFGGVLAVDTRANVGGLGSTPVTATASISDKMTATLFSLVAGAPVVSANARRRRGPGMRVRSLPEMARLYRRHRATEAVAAGSVIDADAALTATASFTADATRAANADATLTGTATITADAALAGLNADAALTASASITATATVTRAATASVTATATHTATAAIARPASAALTAAAGITAAATVVKSVSASLTATATHTATASTVRVATAALTATATITADAAVGVVALLTGTATITATAVRLAAASAALTATATRTATATVTAAASASITATAAITATATVTRAGSATLTATATHTATADVESPAPDLVPRPGEGTTPRTFGGLVARPSGGMTARTSSGTVPRPFAGTTPR